MRPAPPPSPAQNAMHVIIVTGLSGSGKSTAIHALEDLDFYCIDNLPVTLIPQFLVLCANSHERISRVALGIDLRERVSLHEYPTVLAELRSHGQQIDAQPPWKHWGSRRMRRPRTFASAIVSSPRSTTRMLTAIWVIHF